MQFSHSSSGWMAIFSFADPVTEIQWSLAQEGPFESTGFLGNYDPNTRRATANPAVNIEAGVSTIYDTHLWIDPSVKLATAQLVYRDGSVSKVRIFRRSAND